MEGLPTTGAVLSALQNAYKAKLAIRRGSVPTAHEMVAYVGPAHHVPGSVWKSLCCQRMALSPCGNWLAVTFKGEFLVESLDPTASGEAAPGGVLPAMYGLVVYSMSDRCTEVCRYWSSQLPIYCWAASTPHLSVAGLHASAGGHHGEPKHASAFVFDCQTKTMLHSLTPRTEEVLHPVKQECQHFAWCSEGRRLLIFSGIEQLHDKTGLLLVVDVWEDSVMLVSLLTVQRPFLGTLAAAWHPRAAIIVLSYGVMMQHPQTFGRAGFLATTLPQYCRLESQPGMGFSPEGNRVMASICAQYDPFNDPVLLPRPHQIGVLDCKLQGSTMLCTLVYERTSFSCCWGPCSSVLVFDLCLDNLGSRHLSLLVDLTAQENSKHIASSALDQPLSFSPSGQLVADNQGDSQGPRISCLSSGMEMWVGSISVSEHFEDNVMCGPFLPSGCGLVVSGSDLSQQSGILHILRWG